MKIHNSMKLLLLIVGVFVSINQIVTAEEDSRQLVKLPEMMQKHMMVNMRDHLAAISEILMKMSSDELDAAAEIAESRLGMSSLASHGADHMSQFMPDGMKRAGTSMHKAASKFAIKAEEGDAAAAYRLLPEVTAACVTCHSGYRIR